MRRFRGVFALALADEITGDLVLAGREDRAKQTWQLLMLELWYRNARSASVAA